MTAVDGAFGRVMGVFRAVIRGLAIHRARVAAAQRIVHGALLVPVFGAMLVAMRLRAWAAGPAVCEATTRFGARIRSYLHDFIHTYLYLFGVWEPDITAFLERRLASWREGDTFVDIGANTGYHVLLAARRIDGRGRIVAIEASPSIFAMLRDNIERNGARDAVRTVPAAASDAQGRVRIYRGPDRNMGLTTIMANRGLAFEADVDAAPLGDLLEPGELATARLVKIDVEGAEPRVLAGMAGFLAACPRDVEIVVELSPRWWGENRRTADDVLAPMVAEGFHVYKIDNNLWPWRYLWADDVRPPRRVRRPLTRRVRRLDLVLSRIDADEL